MYLQEGIYERAIQFLEDYLNESEGEILLSDIYTGKVNTSSFARWTEEHKKFVNILGNMVLQLAYDVMLGHCVTASAKTTAARSEGGTDAIQIGKTDVKGLEGVTFEGQSPKVRSEAGLPDVKVTGKSNFVIQNGQYVE